MLKSQLESSQNYETTSMFVENIFDTVKKAKAAKAAKSLAESKLMTPYQYPYDDPPPVKKKRPRKNAKKNGKVKKTSTPKKKTTTPRKPKTLKEDTVKRKKASPVKSPRKYTKRAVTKVPAPTDIDDEEAAFILSSISQRSFDSFYNRFNSCGTNKIHIPLDPPSLSVKNHSTDSVKNQAYYVMLDHNYWIVEPAAEETITKQEVTEESISKAGHCSSISSTETQPKNGLIHVEPPVKLEAEKKPEVVDAIANELIITGINNCSNTDIKMNEVNNNKVLEVKEKLPEKATLSNNTSVKKRWLRQAASEIKTPPKKRKNAEVVQIESKRKVEVPVTVEDTKCSLKESVQKQVKVEEPAKVEKSAKVEESAKIEEQVNVEEEAKVEEPVKVEEPAKVKEQAKVEESAKIEEHVKVEEEVKVEQEENSSKVPENEIPKETNEVQVNPMEVEVKIQRKHSPAPVETLKPQEMEIPPAVSLHDADAKPCDVKKELTSDSSIVNDDKVQPTIVIPESAIVIPEEIASTPVITPKEEPTMVKEEKNYDSDECDKRSWETVMDFHRLQLKKLTNANNRFSEVQTNSEPKRENSLFEHKFKQYDSVHSQYAPEATLHFNSTRSPFPESPFSLLRKPDFVSTRKTSVSMDTNQYSLIPPAFQRSVSDISLLDTRRSRWRSELAPSFYSNSIPSYNSLGDNVYNKHEPYSKTNYSTYRAQKALCINNKTLDTVESMWEVPFDANKTKSENFLASFNNNDDNATENPFKRSVIEKNIPRKTAIALTKSKTSVSDPRLNPSLQHDARKDELTTPKKKLSLDQYRKRVSLTTITESSSSSPPEENSIHTSPAFDPSIAEAAANG